MVTTCKICGRPSYWEVCTVCQLAWAWQNRCNGCPQAGAQLCLYCQTFRAVTVAEMLPAWKGVIGQ